jgi:hypothetical protein
MNIYYNFKSNYPEDPIRYLGFEKYQTLPNNIDLFYGASQSEEINKPSNNTKILFATEEQIDDSNEKYRVADIHLFEDKVDKILSISPLCYKKAKRQYVFFPFNDDYEPLDKTKKYSIIYTGYAPLPHVDNIINTIVKFDNHKIVSFNHPKATNSNVSYIEKLQLVANSKISVVHNLITDDIPQLKTRPFEAAFCKSLIICKYDKFKTLEKWFTPNEDFLYYYDDSELESIITKALDNYEDFHFMVKNAYIKAKNNYTTKHFIEKYLQ